MRRALILAVALVAVSATAFAYWATAGSGSSGSSVGRTQALTLSPATPSTPLYPGAGADVALHVANPNATAVTLKSLQLDTAGISVDGAHGGCDPAAVSFTPQDNGGSGWLVPTGGLDIDVAGAVTLASTAADACQGATFTVYLRAGS